MHKLTLETGLVSGDVAVAVCSSLPIKGVSFILGNDLACGRVLTAPEVVPFPVVSKRPDDLQKPNQKIPSAPLPPIPAIGEPFERILIDCVGPLPRTKSGNRYLLTIMCTATRFPEAIPLRRITASAISKALIKFFAVFGLPRVIQTDQGSNFMSRVFSQVLQQLSIEHQTSSACHPESQGALERFHQTLKSMLRAYCKEFERDWDERTPLLLFAAREVTQESLGFSPAELVFGHTVRGPMNI